MNINNNIINKVGRYQGKEGEHAKDDGRKAGNMGRHHKELLGNDIVLPVAIFDHQSDELISPDAVQGFQIQQYLSGLCWMEDDNNLTSKKMGILP